MEAKPRCAYHEAGHCVLAFSMSTYLIKSVTIRPPGAPPNDQWQGDANIRWEELDDPREVAVIAVAGILAEAKAACLALPAGEQPIGGVILGVTQDFLDQFDTLYGPAHFGNLAQNSWPIHVPVGAGGATEPAAISRADMNRIAEDLRVHDELRPILQDACDCLNHAGWWRGVRNLAVRLDVPEPIPVLKSFAVYDAVHTGLRAPGG
jgi:hypothetical protein